MAEQIPLMVEFYCDKKTIYKYFCNKETLIEHSTKFVHEKFHYIIDTIASQNYNAIKENFEIRNMFKEMFKSSDNSPIYQLKKHYPEIYHNVIRIEIEECKSCFYENINKGIAEGLYRKDIDIDCYVRFYYILIFHINS